MAQFYSLTIKEIHRLTPQSVALTFSIPDALKEVFTFIPGQYITLQSEIDGAQVRRDYSICSSKNTSEISVGIKAVEKGLFSQFANTKLEVGDVLEVAAPTGRFNLHIDQGHKKRYAAFAAGSGITPILSMIRSALEEEPESSFVLVFGNKRRDDVMFYNTLQELQERFKNRLIVRYIFSQENLPEYWTGRISADTVQKVTQLENGKGHFDAYFLCGPEPMINEVKEALEGQGVNPDAIHFELFTTTVTEDSVDAAYDGETEVHMILDDEEESFTMRGDQSI